MRFELTTWSLGETRSSNWATESYVVGEVGLEPTRVFYTAGLEDRNASNYALYPQVCYDNGHHKITRSPVIYKIHITGFPSIRFELNINKKCFKKSGNVLIEAINPGMPDPAFDE